jgi:hypothetical protein
MAKLEDSKGSWFDGYVLMRAESDDKPLVHIEILTDDSERLSVLVTLLEGDPTINFTVV